MLSNKRQKVDSDGRGDEGNYRVQKKEKQQPGYIMEEKSIFNKERKIDVFNNLVF